MSNFCINYEILSDFSKNVERFISDRKFIYILNHNGFVAFYSSGLSSYCYLITDVEVNNDFNIGINSDRFLSFSKKLYEGNIKFSITKNDLVMKKDNITVKFPVVSFKAYIPKLSGTLVDKNINWLLNSLCNSGISISDKTKGLSKKFYGTLIDNSVQNCKVCRFSESSIYVSTGESILQSNNRFVVSDHLIKSLKAVKDDVAEFYISENSCCLKLKNNIFINVNNASDSYPELYMDHLKLSDDINMLDEYDEGAKFCANILFNAFDLVSSALGDQDFWITMHKIGLDTNGCSVFKVFGKSSLGVEAAEAVSADDDVDLTNFSVHKTSVLKALSIFNNDVYLTDLGYSSVSLSNIDGSELILLIKINL